MANYCPQILTMIANRSSVCLISHISYELNRSSDDVRNSQFSTIVSMSSIFTPVLASIPLMQYPPDANFILYYLITKFMVSRCPFESWRWAFLALNCGTACTCNAIFDSVLLRRISSPCTKLLAARCNCECMHEHFHPITMLEL